MSQGRQDLYCWALLLTLPAFLLAGCASAPMDASFPLGAPSAVRKKLDVSLISLGMPSQQVKNLLRNKIILGYEIQRGASSSVQPIYFKNLYRSEIYRKDARVFEVDYYFLEVHKQDGVITEDELLPLVFENDQLRGQGWSFWDRLRKENQLHL